MRRLQRFWLVLALAGCGDDAADERARMDAAITCNGAAPYAATGPYAAGVTTLDLGGVPLEVWYPAAPGDVRGRPKAKYDMRDWLPDSARQLVPDADAPLFEMNAVRDVPAARADRRFPLFVFSHGLGGYRMQSSFLMTHLATWGFVVAAPEHPERGLKILVERGTIGGDMGPQALEKAVTVLEAEDARAGGRLEGRIDFARRVVAGHSAGGAAVLALAKKPEWTTWITYASGGFGGNDPVSKPLLMMGGTSDGIADMDLITKAFASQPSGKRLVALDHVGHLGFSDICAIGRDRGGVLQIALDHGLPVPELLQLLGTDGCRAMDRPAEQGWPVINHFTVAHARTALGLDPAPVGLGGPAAECFGGRVARLEQQ